MVPAFSNDIDYVDMPEKEFDAIGEYIPEEVCHYTKMSIALTKILPNKQILLGNLDETNDPLETQGRWKDSINNSSRGYGGIVGLVRKYVSPKNIKVFSTCCHNNPSWNELRQQSEAYKYGACRSSMWAHYSDGHKGVCIIFDGKALDKHIKDAIDDKDRVQHGFVKYNYAASIQPLQGNLWENYKSSFLCKSPEWKPEHEFRWLVQTENASKFISMRLENNSKLLLPIENDSKLLVSIENTIKAIIIGKNFDKECMPLLKKLCGELGVSSLWQIDWMSGKPFISSV